MIKIDAIKKYLSDNLSEKRYRHSLGVADEAVCLAERYGADREKAYIAGLVHDCAKEIPANEAIGILKEEYGAEIDDVTLATSNLLHGILGVYVMRDKFGIVDPDIADAVRYHTTGKADMPILSKIIYIADFIEPGRNFDGVDKLRELTYKDIDDAIIFGIDFTICDLVKKGRPVHTDTVCCRNWLLLRKESL